jgi:hypothetical protein
LKNRVGNCQPYFVNKVRQLADNLAQVQGAAGQNIPKILGDASDEILKTMPIQI